MFVHFPENHLFCTKYYTMIQRVQSIYLLIASIIMSLLFLTSIVLVKISGTIPEKRKSLAYLGDEILDMYDHSVFIILIFLLVFVSLVVFFLFNFLNYIFL